MNDNTIRIIPLGGLGEFGMNCMVIEASESAIVVDCGMMFPDASTLGVDVIIPDLSYIETIHDKITGIFLTHGHEDHIGAVPFLHEIAQVPLFGSPLTIQFLEGKFRELNPKNDPELVTLTAGVRVESGQFAVEPIHVTHSIVDAFAFAIETPAGRLIHTGDFKLDPSPIDGKTTELDRFRHFGDQGTRLLISDSTNAMRPGRCGSESSVGPSLLEIFERAPQRVFVTSFASHIHRLQQVVNAAEKSGRSVWMMGRSMIQNIAIAEKLRYLSIPRSVRGHGKYPDRDDGSAVILCTGSQGEPRSALARLSRGENAQIALQEGDTVVFSTRTIPGNEREVMHVINNIIAAGASVIYEREGVHVSGHANHDELTEILELVRPELFLPVHGHLFNLSRHRELAMEWGLDQEQTFLATDGNVIEISPEGAIMLGERVPSGRVFVDRELEEIPSIVLRDRRHLAEDGFVIVVVALDQNEPRTAPEIEIITRGVVYVDDNQELLSEVQNLLRNTLTQAPQHQLTDEENVQDLLRAELKRFFRKRLGRRPMILPVVWEM